MSTRYGIFIVPQPEFTARAYKARQIICGQYGAWAAEMLMVHIMLAGYFPCSDAGIEPLDLALGKLATAGLGASGQITLDCRGVAAADDLPGTLYLDFGPLNHDDSLKALYGNIVDLVKGYSETGDGLFPAAEDFKLRLPLMQFAGLPASVFSDALEFATGVVTDIGLPESTHAWRLMLARFHSQAAGESWASGSWAADISWELLSSYPL